MATMAKPTRNFFINNLLVLVSPHYFMEPILENDKLSSFFPNVNTKSLPLKDSPSAKKNK
jgi:hypothetical protein